uniref:DNA repair protein rev1 n=1 Tax=Lygus hesperus TaxID=30085 RepID=A0A0A9VW84_LYGHE
MDAFFCSVQLAKPEYAHLRSKPVGIAAGHNNSDIASCNYVARTYGIHAGMYVNKAKSHCPSLVILDYDLPSCERIAQTLYRILFERFPSSRAHMSMEVYSVDEVMIAVDTDSITSMINYCNDVRAEL